MQSIKYFRNRIEFAAKNNGTIKINNQDIEAINKLIEWEANQYRNTELEDSLSENIVDIIETAQGCHLITKKFNTEAFHEHFKKVIDIHKDNPTLLYYAENGRKDL